MSETVRYPKRRLVRRREAAAYCFGTYGFGTASSFAKLAHEGRGAPYALAMGRFAVYDLDDLDAWAEQQLSRKACKASDIDAEAA